LVSIKDIAERAKVSIGTVDRVLHNRGRVSDETKARVERIVLKLGYRPNIHARNLSLSRSFHFGVVIPRPSQDCSYWRIPAKGIEKARGELEIYNVGIRYHSFDRYSERSFERAFLQALKEKPDGLLIAPVLPEIGARLIPTIPENIPYVFFDSTIPATNCLTFIGQDPFQSGVLAGRLMLGALREAGDASIVKVVPADFHINERIRGFTSALALAARKLAEVYEVDSHGGDAAFSEVTRKMLREHSRLRGIFVSNAWTHAIARHVQADPRGKSISIIGYDLVAGNIQSLEEGSIEFLISQRPEMQGYEGIYSLYEHVVLRGTVKPRIMLPIDILTKDNIKYYQN
jgi:LacI family transcriptional regulator